MLLKSAVIAFSRNTVRKFETKIEFYLSDVVCSVGDPGLSDPFSAYINLVQTNGHTRVKIKGKDGGPNFQMIALSSVTRWLDCLFDLWPSTNNENLLKKHFFAKVGKQIDFSKIINLVWYIFVM